MIGKCKQTCLSAIVEAIVRQIAVLLTIISLYLLVSIQASLAKTIVLKSISGFMPVVPVYLWIIGSILLLITKLY